MLKKKFQISEEEFIEFSRKSMTSTKLVTVLVTGALLFGGSVALTYQKDGIANALVMSLVLFLIYFVLVFGVMLITTPRIAKRVYKKNNIGNFVFELEFNTSGIKQNKDIYYYQQFKKIVETKLAFHFYLQQKQIIVVSKRVFDEQELEELKNLLRNSKDIKKLQLLSNKNEK